MKKRTNYCFWLSLSADRLYALSDATFAMQDFIYYLIF